MRIEARRHRQSARSDHHPPRLRESRSHQLELDASADMRNEGERSESHQNRLMAHLPGSTKSLLFIALAGFASAFLTTAIVPKLSELAGITIQFDPEGPIFGGSIAAYCFFYDHRFRSVWKIAAFVIVCSAADVAATLVAFQVDSRIPHQGITFNGSAGLDIPLSVFFAGGFIGAFIVLTAALFLFGLKTAGWGSSWKIVAGALIGGALGVAGWCSGPLLGRALWIILQQSHLRPSRETYETAIQQQTPEWVALIFVWQVGVALLVGLILRVERTAASMD